MQFNTEKLLVSLKHPHGNGPVTIVWQKCRNGLWATTGRDETLAIYDQYGHKMVTLPLTGMCTGLAWDHENGTLGIISDKTPVLTLWNSHSQKMEKIDTGMRDALTFIAWATASPFLAIGTARGNLLLYNHRTTRKMPILGKHSKRITCGAWSSDNLLALGSDDKSLSVSSLEGDTVLSIPLRAEPAQIQFAEMKIEEHIGDSTVSLIAGRRTLMLLNVNDPENPIELAFQQKYGNITTYRWFGDGYILLGFSAGFLIAISTHMKEIGQELFQVRDHRDKISCIALCPAIGKAASCGENSVKIHELHDLKETSSVITIGEESSIDSCSWSQDGRLIAVTGSSGNVYLFLTRLDLRIAPCSLNGTIAALTNLKEVTLYDVVSNNSNVVIKSELEPNFVALSPRFLAMGLNNRACFYRCDTKEIFRESQYVGTVEQMQINDHFAAALIDGKVYVHPIDENAENKQSGVFPQRETSPAVIVSHCVTKDFLIYATDIGDLTYFLLDDWKLICEYRHAAGWKDIYPSPSGTLLAAVDVKGYCYLYSPVKEVIHRVSNFPPQSQGIVWDSSSSAKDVFLSWTLDQIDVFIHHKEKLTGSCITLLCSIPLHSSQVPSLLHGSDLTLITSSANVVTVNVPHLGLEPETVLENLTRDELVLAFRNAVSLARYSEAWKLGLVLGDTDEWKNAARNALEDLNIDFAIRVYRHLGEVSLVWSLEEIAHVEDLNLLCGHVWMVMGNLQKAQEAYLNSSKPEVALEMFTDVMKWEEALNLAEKMAPQKIGIIAREYAQQLENMGDYVSALKNYERALATDSSDERHVTICRYGMARSSVGSGDVRKGVALTLQLGSRELTKECAQILEDSKYYSEAAQLYETAGIIDKAAVLYARLKNWTKVGQFIKEISQPSVHFAYAKAKESEGSFKEALTSYELAGEYESAISLCLGKLHSPQDAIRIARKSNSVEGAKLIAKYFMQLGDHSSALEYLVLSKNFDAAFEVAQQNGQVELYAEILGEEAKTEDFLKIAVYFEKEKNSLYAGKFYALAGNPARALKHLLKAAQSGNEEEKALNAAVQIVGNSNDEHLVKELVSFLQGEVDNIPKDGKYLFRLYLARKQYKEAAKTAVIIATEEQNSGNYRDAHSLLLHMYQELRNHAIAIPAEMEHSLQILHSYVIVRSLIRRGSHLNAARMLIRVAASISKFPAHSVPILTSTVIECDRAGLKNAAYQHAVLLLKPEYRDSLDPKYKKKIEATVRRPPRGYTDPEESLSACPHCAALVPETLLVCSQCKMTIPQCIATGYHVIKDNVTRCGSCRFMAIRSELIKLIEAGEACPMCGQSLGTVEGLPNLNSIK